ncbi:MAG: Hemerythrin HHE cation binding domain-containing protein [Candidatus Kentron sp. G]|nr:MAG: Hemerythrin HHE cation binding domain-containing protein [Candidatus Kentron sp. G]
MTNYPDLFHHPKEDILFQRVTKRDESANSIVAELVQDHHALADQGKALFDLLHALIHEHPVERGTLEAKAREYILTLRTHMNLEEGTLLPMAKKVLHEEDWSEIEGIMGNRDDPLFGENIVQAEYLALYEYIRNHE